MTSNPPLPKRSRRRRWPLRAFALVVVAAITLVAFQACSMPGPIATKQQIAALARERTAPTDSNLALSYLRAGDASHPRVIYIHGTPGSADGWADYLVSPVPGLEAIAVDRLGFGESAGRNGGVDSFQSQAEAIAPLLVKRSATGGDRWPIIVGHSLGGPIAARLAAMYPDRVGGLIIVAGSLDPAQEKPGLGQSIATTGFVRFFLPTTLDNSMGELDAAKQQTTLLAPELAKVICPVTIIHGTTDQLVPYANVAYMQRTLTGAAPLRITTLPGQGHFIPWERADAIRQAVADMHTLYPPTAK
jgi:pimeloyl-ACP methyl ester carboxylesterase